MFINRRNPFGKPDTKEWKPVSESEKPIYLGLGFEFDSSKDQFRRIDPYH